MAKQHLYSRVPAKLSMFNRFDSFDTFAHSDGLTREFIERELSCAYTNKLSKNDAEAVRTGKMPPVYSQFPLRSGPVAQTCTSYLPLDYTGERSAYLSHTLILEEAEQQQLLCSREHAIFNPRMFTQDVSQFHFTSPAAAADCNFPEATYSFCPPEDTKELISRYDADVVKKFLRAIFATLCANGKAVYFKLGCEDAETSEEALKLICAVATVIPYHLRKDLSFVTYVTDPGQYSHTKLKCLSASCPEVAPAKGAFFDLHTGLATGPALSSAMEQFPSGFFYTLLENADLRDRFLSFVAGAVKEKPNLEKLGVKALCDLVFLFCGANTSFARQNVLPTDEKLYDFLCVYEKYRNVLDLESREYVYANLQRYPERHEAIPKNIFAKLSRLYPDEPHSVKRMAIRVVLDLLHTDIMRDKLFTFIKNNYSGEDEDIRSEIHADLCRVYYGGFLQSQILGFFSDHFAEESEATQDAVLEKILLTVRTQNIQQKILQFLTANYGIFTPGQKQAIYSTAFEMLPECDSLTRLMIDFLDETASQEAPQLQEQYRQRLQELILSDRNSPEPKLMALLCKNMGFCHDAVLSTVFASNDPGQIYDDYMAILAPEAVFRKSQALLRISQLYASSRPELQNRLMQSLPALFPEDAPRANLFEWIEADRLAAQAPKTDKFAAAFRKTVIFPAITDTLPDVFDGRLFPDGMENIKAYARENPQLQETKPYKALQVFWFLEQAIENQDARTLYKCLRLLLPEPMKGQIAARLRSDYSRKENLGVESCLFYQISLSILKDGILADQSLYAQASQLHLQRALSSQGENPGSKKAAQEAAVFAAELMFEALNIACQTGSVFTQMLAESPAALDGFLSACCKDYRHGASKWILSCFAEAPEELYALIRDSLSRVKPSGRNMLAQIFRKKS